MINFELKVGRDYKTLSGKIITIVEEFKTLQSEASGFFFASDGRVYTKDGQRYISHLVSDCYLNDPISMEIPLNPLKSKNILSLTIGKSYHNESGKIVFIQTELQNFFQGDSGFLYSIEGQCLPRAGDEGIEIGEDLIFEYGNKPPITDPIEYLNTLSEFVESVTYLRSSLQQGGYCGESTGDIMGRQRWNSTIEMVCDKLLGKKD